MYHRCALQHVTACCKSTCAALSVVDTKARPVLRVCVCPSVRVCVRVCVRVRVRAWMHVRACACMQVHVTLRVRVFVRVRVRVRLSRVRACVCASQWRTDPRAPVDMRRHVSMFASIAVRCFARLGYITNTCRGEAIGAAAHACACGSVTKQAGCGTFCHSGLQTNAMKPCSFFAICAPRTHARMDGCTRVQGLACSRADGRRAIGVLRVLRSTAKRPRAASK